MTGSAASERKVGYGIQSTFLSNGTPVAFRMLTGDSVRLFDIELQSGMTFGSYGTQQGETGIDLWTYNGSTQQAGTMSYVGGQNSSNVGTRLNVSVVPEPSGILALALGVLAVRRRASARA